MAIVAESTSRLILDGNADGMIAAMMRAETSVREQTSMIQGHFTAMGASVNKVIGLVGTASAIMAGGAIFKAMVEGSQSWVGETIKLAKILGTTTEEAGAYKVAIHSVGLEQEVLEKASLKLGMVIASNPDKFQRLGIAIKDSRGALLPMPEIIMNTIERLNGMEAGTNRNSAASLLFGRNWKDSMGILKLSLGLIDESRTELKSLGLEVGPERVQQFYQYRTEMKYTGLVAEAMKVQVGNALLPILINLGQWFHDIGPTALFIFGGALKGVVTFVEYATLGVRFLWETWDNTWNLISHSAVSMVQVITQIIQGDFAGAWNTAKQGVADFGKYGEQWFDNIANAAEKTNSRVSKLWGMTAATAAKSAPKTGDKFDTDNPTDVHKAQMGVEQARLQAILDGYKNRQAAIRESNATLIDEDNFYYKIGIEGQEQFNAKKYEIERSGFINSMSIVDQEIAAIEASRDRKLKLAENQQEREKIAADMQKQVADRVAEKEKLNSELYRLDLKYFTDTTSLEQERQSTMANILVEWAQKRSVSDEYETQKTKEFYGMVSESYGDITQRQLAEIDREEQEQIRSWAMQTSSFETYENRKAQIQQFYANKRIQLERSELQVRMGYAQSGFSSLASIADSFYQLSGQKSRAAFVAYQIAKSGETVISTASAAMKAYDAMASIPYIGPALGAAAAAAAIAAGAVQLKNIWAQSYDTSNATMNAGNLPVTGDSSSSGKVVTQPVSSNASSQPSGPIYNVTITGGYFGTDKNAIARDLIPAINQQLAEGVH